MATGMTISRFAKTSGVGIETVRYYQRRGLLPVPSPRSRSYREYDDGMVRRLRFIKSLQTAGFTLREIRELIRLDRSSERMKIQDIATRKLDELTVKIRELRRISKGLQSLVADCRSACPGTACPIIEAFDH